MKNYNFYDEEILILEILKKQKNGIFKKDLLIKFNKITSISESTLRKKINNLENKKLIKIKLMLRNIGTYSLASGKRKQKVWSQKLFLSYK